MSSALLRVVAVVRPMRLDAVVEALEPFSIRDLLIEQVRGYGRQKEHLEIYEEGLGEAGFLPKVRLEFLLPRDRLDGVVDAIRATGSTGRIGDGKVFVHALGDDGAPAARLASSAVRGTSDAADAAAHGERDDG